MAAVKGANVTKYDAGPSGDNAISQGFWKANEQIIADSYEAAALAADSTIDIAVLPSNAKVTGVHIAFDALGSGVTLAVGDAGDADRYILATSASSAGETDAIRVDGLQYVIGTDTTNDDTRIQITTAGGAATGTIKSIVRWTK